MFLHDKNSGEWDDEDFEPKPVRHEISTFHALVAVAAVGIYLVAGGVGAYRLFLGDLLTGSIYVGVAALSISAAIISLGKVVRERRGK